MQEVQSSGFPESKSPLGLAKDCLKLKFLLKLFCTLRQNFRKTKKKRKKTFTKKEKDFFGTFFIFQRKIVLS